MKLFSKYSNLHCDHGRTDRRHAIS